jgi:hypothetical protein
MEKESPNTTANEKEIVGNNTFNKGNILLLTKRA